jgi:hypothetical protein
MRRIQRCEMKLFELHFHIPEAVLFVLPGLKIGGHGNPDNNLESHYISYVFRIAHLLTVHRVSSVTSPPQSMSELHVGTADGSITVHKRHAIHSVFHGNR